MDVSFRDATLPELVRFVARVTGRRFILTGDLREVRVSIVSERPVTPGELYDGFLAALHMQGLTVVRAGRYHRVVRTEGIEGRGVPVVTDAAARRGSEAMVLRLHRVPTGDVEEAAALLRRFASPGGVVTAHPGSRHLLIRDTAANVRRMLTILARLRGAPDRAPEEVHVERLEHGDARDVARAVEGLAE